MKTIGWGALFASLASLGGARTALAQPASMQIEDFTYAGSGCPAGSVGASLSEARDTIVFLLPSLIAKTPPGTFDRKNCQIVLKLRSDPGWSFSIRRVNYHGFAVLEAGTFGQQQSTYFFQGVPPAGDVSGQTTITGPYHGAYSRSDDLREVLWSPCGGTSQTLVINSQVRVGGPEGLMTVDPTSGNVTLDFDLQWRACR